jgi:glycosyltransferase involved in cell wall biosynthesis
MKKLLHIIDTLAIGGAETLLIKTIHDLSDYENHLIILGKPDTLIDRLPASCKRTVLNFRSYKDVWSTARKVKKYIFDNNIQIVHSNLYWSNVVARLACPHSVKLFNSIHAISSEASYKINKLTLYIEKFTYKKRHHIIGVSEEVLKDFDKWTGLKGKSSVLYNMVDDSFFSIPKTEFSKGKLNMVSVGNLRWQKNYQYLVDAFKHMPATVKLDIYGEGSLRNKLQTQIDEHQLAIKLKGHSLELVKILRTYDVFVMSSFYEGSSLALMEAMAMGLPVLLSDIPVLREAAGDSALYFNIKDPVDLSRKVKEILEGKVSLEELSAKSIARASALAHREEFIKKLINIYENEA